MVIDVLVSAVISALLLSIGWLYDNDVYWYCGWIVAIYLFIAYVAHWRWYYGKK